MHQEQTIWIDDEMNKEERHPLPAPMRARVLEELARLERIERQLAHSGEQP